MKLKGIQKRLLSLFTMVTFTLGGFAPQAIQAATAADQDMKLVVSIVNNSKIAYGKLPDGANVFANKVLEGFPASDVKYIKSVLNLTQMPKAEFNKGQMTFSLAKKQVTVKTVNQATGEFLVNGKRYTFHKDQSFKSNLDRFLKISDRAEFSWVDALIGLVVPVAHAGDDDAVPGKKKDRSDLWKTIAIGVAAVIGIALIAGVAAYWINSRSDDKRSDNETTVQLAQIARRTEADKNATEIKKLRIEKGVDSGSDSDSGGSDSHGGGTSEL